MSTKRGLGLGALGVGLWLMGGCSALGLDGSETESMPPEKFYKEFREAVCELAANCCQAEGFERNPSCAQTPMNEFSAYTSYLRISPKAEWLPARSYYDGRAAVKCIALIRAMKTCSFFDYRRDMKACGKVFVGTTEPGRDCQSDFECKEPDYGYAYCDVKYYDDLDSYEGQLIRKCIAFAYYPQGTSCAGFKSTEYYSERCEPNTQCTLPSRTCEPLHTMGQTCHHGEICLQSICDDTAERCVPYRAEGESCWQSEECATGRCDGGRCVPRSEPEHPPGSACTTSAYCACVAGICHNWDTLALGPACLIPGQ